MGRAGSNGNIVAGAALPLAIAAQAPNGFDLP